MRNGGRSIRTAAAALAIFAALASAQAQNAPAPAMGAGASALLHIHLNDERAAVREFRVSDHGVTGEGLRAAERFTAEEWSRVLVASVAAGDSSTTQAVFSADAPAAKPSLPMAGACGVAGSDLYFRPRYPLRPGVPYVVWFDGAALAELLRTRGIAYSPAIRQAVDAPFEIAAADATPAAVVEAIHPGAKLLPANTLKFYIEFSEPMSRGGSYAHVSLVRIDHEGMEDVVAAPFLELTEELWSPDGKRFTLFLHPGRIKQGLVPNLEDGPPLLPGQRYILRVKPSWKDEQGRPLKQGFDKPFETAPRDETSPDPRRWKIVPPNAGTTAPLTVDLHESLDHALLHRLVEVRGPADRPVAGRVETNPADTQWIFTPDTAWEAGSYALIVSPLLEDLAGNSVGKPFEVMPEDRPLATRDVRLEFSIR